MTQRLFLHQLQSPRHLRLRVPLWSGILGVLLLSLAHPSYAAHWQAVGPASSAALGLAYIDFDSVHEEEGFRVALFLTIYSSAIPNAHDIKLDRITQETAFDCTRREFALRSTIGFFQGKAIGGSSNKDDWKRSFKPVPKDAFSQRALDLACNARLAPQPEPVPAASEAPGSVKLPGLNGVVPGPPAPKGSQGSSSDH